MREYVQQETLEGVCCSRCDGKHDAHRNIALLEPPPVLTLQLLRFVYDMATFSKKKVFASPPTLVR